MKMTGGRVNLGGGVLPTVLLTVPARKSGVERTVPLVYFSDGDDVILMASSFGRPKLPAWYHNVKASSRGHAHGRRRLRALPRDRGRGAGARRSLREGEAGVRGLWRLRGAHGGRPPRSGAQADASHISRDGTAVRSIYGLADAPAIETRALERTFSGGVKAVQGVDLAVADGEIYAFLGPNGAGKTTTVRMLTTLLKPSAGSATVAGFDVVNDAAKVRRAIGVALQEAALDPLMTGRELMRLQATLHGIPKARLRAAGRRADRPSGTDERGGPPRRHLLGRDAAPARPRNRARARAERALPRRADHRPRPGQPRGDLGRGAQAERRGHDRLPHDAVPGGGGPARRPRGDHRRGPAWPRRERRAS